MTDYLTFVERIPTAAYVMHVVGDEFIMVQVNAAGRQRNPELVALCGKPMASLYRDQPQVIVDARRCVVEQTVVDRVLPVRRYDRTEATQNLRLTFVPAPPEHIVLLLQDVADPVVAQTALRESEARYRSLVASLPDAVVMCGADGRILFCNEHAVRLFCAESQAALIGETEFLPPGLEFQTETGVRMDTRELPCNRVLCTGRAEHGQVFALAGHGSLRWLTVAAQPIHSTTGQITGSVATFTDITDRVQAQGALRESAVRLEMAFDAAKMGVWEFDPSSDSGWWSPNLKAILKIGGRERGMAGFLARVHPEDLPEIINVTQALVAGNVGDSFEQQFRIVGEDQVTRWVRVRGSLTQGTTRPRVVGTMVDVTEQRQLEEELRRANRLESLGRLAGGIAHDFNNLLAAMLGSVDLIENECPEDTRQDLATIRHSALRARDLTRQLLAFARKQPVEWQSVDLALLVRKVDLMLRRLVGPNIDMVIASSGSVPVRADAAQMEQVLVNLVVNARDAMPNGGRLEIRVDREPNESNRKLGGQRRAVLWVIDSGSGMDEHTRLKIFDPFFTTKPQGTGLGLASCYGIVRQHQGDITVDSQPGKGTRFRVTLPLAAEADCVESESHDSAPTVQTAGVVLVVDDEDLVRETAARMLRSLGYEVLVAASAAESFELAARQLAEVDILLCDIAMPGTDGLSVAAALRERHPRLKIALMSGYTADANDGLPEGALFLQKPFSRRELAEMLADLARR